MMNMDGNKWLLLVCSTILAFIPAVVLYRDWRHYDRRTTRHKNITVLLLLVSTVAAIGVGWATFKTLSKRERSPSFEFYVNRQRFDHGSLVSVPISNGQQTITFAIKNVGDWLADAVRLHFLAPSNFDVDLPNWRGEWRQGILDKGNTIADNDKYFYTEAWDIPARVTVVCPDIVIRLRSPQPAMTTMLFALTAKNSESEQNWFILQSHDAVQETQVQTNFWKQSPTNVQAFFRESKKWPFLSTSNTH